ncbi:MAG: hypothetical protein WDO56_21455 [Gammaproteobacteria bacterium]
MATRSWRRPAFALMGALALALAMLAGTAASADKPAPGPGGHPDLSGFWNHTAKVVPDKVLMARVPANTAVLQDTGAIEFPRGEYGGLKPKPKALAAAEKWDPREDLSLTNACKPPSIVYAMQGPFPMEIYQGTEFVILKLEYFDMMRVVFMDGRKPEADTPDSKVGFSTGHWEGDTLVVDTTHIEAATIANNGLSHSNKVHVIERFRLSDDGSTLMSTQEFEDPDVLDNRGARFIAWKKKTGDHVYPYECDPTFAIEYQKQLKDPK